PMEVVVDRCLLEAHRGPRRPGPSRARAVGPFASAGTVEAGAQGVCSAPRGVGGGGAGSNAGGLILSGLRTTSRKSVNTAAPGRACSVLRNSLRSDSPRPPQALPGSAMDTNQKSVTTAAPGRACSVLRNSLRSDSPRPPQALPGSAMDT